MTSQSVGDTPRRSDGGEESEFHRELGLFDSTMIVVGAMIGSGIFIVPAEMSRLVGSPGWLLMAWLLTGVLTLAAALSYGELAAMMPRAGGMYVYLREAFSPLWGFLYGWTLFLVIQTGFIAAVAVAFARYAGAIWPALAEDQYLVPPLHLSAGYAVSLSANQLLAVLLIAALTITNMCGLKYGKLVQNVFTVAKTGALAAMIVLGLTVGWNSAVVSENLAAFWLAQPVNEVGNGLTAASSFGLFVAVCLSQTGSLFSADSWHNVTFTAGEVRNPRRNLPLSLALGSGLVIMLYLLANLAYLATLPLADIQHAPSDRVATAMIESIFPGVAATSTFSGIAATSIALAIMVSTFGCDNGLILAGARTYYAMARDGLFFKPVARLNAARVPAWGLALQGLWAALLVLPRTYRADHDTYGNLYSDLLDYVIPSALLFYILTIIGLFRLRRVRPDAERPYQAFGYPVLPALYVAGAATIAGVLFLYQPMTSLPGLVIVLLGVPVFFAWKRRGRT
ncbi:MAG TPA: amino acid permease [Pirellulales bacterium]|nr:amino acid permease [Pirellulales bacterium]